MHCPYRVPEAAIESRYQDMVFKKKLTYKFVKLKSFETVCSDLSQVLTIMCMSQAIEKNGNISIEYKTIVNHTK